MNPHSPWLRFLSTLVLLNDVKESYSRGLTYHYHSGNRQGLPLDVTVKNHQVVTIKGGYE